eukprot:sb/3464120/
MRQESTALTEDEELTEVSDSSDINYQDEYTGDDCLSDSELYTVQQTQHHLDHHSNRIVWNWGSLPSDTAVFDLQEGMFLDDIDTNDPYEVAHYFGVPAYRSGSRRNREEDGTGHHSRAEEQIRMLDALSLEAPRYPTAASNSIQPETAGRHIQTQTRLTSKRNKRTQTIEEYPSSDYELVQLSLCGIEDLDMFHDHLVSYDSVSADPSIIESKDLMVRVGEDYYSWAEAPGNVLLAIAFQDFRSVTESECGERSASLYDETIYDEEDRRPRYTKKVRLSSEEIEQLELESGPNVVTFSVTTRLQDWTQNNIAKLFTAIENNGYKFLYLSSRAIGQASMTKSFLKSIKQNGVGIPEGPMLLSPDSLLRAIKDELVLRQPHIFKIKCLMDIKNLFGKDASPFYAGFGNRVTDSKSYQAVNIPPHRVFIINHRTLSRRSQTGLRMRRASEARLDVISETVPTRTCQCQANALTTVLSRELGQANGGWTELDEIRRNL